MPGPVERTPSTGAPAAVSTAQAAHEQQSFSTATSLRSSSSTPGSGRKDMRRLAAEENDCCSWAAWAVETVAGTPVLDVRSTGPGIATLHGMFRPGQADPAGR